jgi:sarcosine oxidase
MDQIKTDVIVIGLGAVGAAALYQLAARRIGVIGIDQYTPPHSYGSSHGETRITRLAVAEGEQYVPIVRRSHTIWKTLEQDSNDSLFHESGILIISGNVKNSSHHGALDFAAKTIKLATKFDIPHEVLDNFEVSRRYPQFLVGGQEFGYFENSGGILFPEKCIMAQLKIATMLGATIRTNEPVLEIKKDGNSIQVHTSLGLYRASRIVLAAGPWIPQLLGSRIGRLVRIFRQVVYFFEPYHPADYSPELCPAYIWIHGQGPSDLFYGFPALPGSRAVKVATEQFETETSTQIVNRSVNSSEITAMYCQHLMRRMRGLSAKCVDAKVCLYTTAPDFGFIIDEVKDTPGMILASACSGHGFKHSAAIGESIAQRIATGHTDIDLSPFSLSRF